jgi:hypothetical protein
MECIYPNNNVQRNAKHILGKKVPSWLWLVQNAISKWANVAWQSCITTRCGMMQSVEASARVWCQFTTQAQLHQHWQHSSAPSNQQPNEQNCTYQSTNKIKVQTISIKDLRQKQNDHSLSGQFNSTLWLPVFMQARCLITLFVGTFCDGICTEDIDDSSSGCLFHFQHHNCCQNLQFDWASRILLQAEERGCNDVHDRR